MTGNPSVTSGNFLTIFEVASILRVSKRTVYHLIHSGDLEAIKVGRTFRIPGHVLKAQASSPGKA